MSTRVTLLCHAATAATGRAAFPLDEPPTAHGRAAAERLAPIVGGKPPRAVRGPELRCADTAAAIGLAHALVEPALRDCDHGSWAGRTLEEVLAADPTGVAAWLGDPDAAPHGGESLTSVLARAGGWLEEQERAGRHGRVVAITHPILARAVAVHALRAPASVFRHLDAGPLARVDLTYNGTRWALRGFGLLGP
ncbi:histidine phosphatase family protein [Embleya sp. NBC_00888]|uniref:histidine phosphatase family protein n=1 Tax=Embleya sp. NBC_00888 TaxID=2975960 RepID=UPI0038631EA6|nr:histidine phosphatase family protein [Embleya sp. NBC_00888]